ncbi:terminase TerL endonuclease subunit [Paracoccus suum]|nr:terminase TerL endonuclease subunit [Paracoccus suum]
MAGKIRLLRKPKPATDPVDGFCAWLESSFVFPAGPRRGEPVTLLPFQRAFVRDVLARDGADPLYRMALFSTPRKNGKSFVLACLLLGFMLEDSPIAIPCCKVGLAAPTSRHAMFIFTSAMDLLISVGREGEARIVTHPQPGSLRIGRAVCDVYSGSKLSGHGASLNVAIVDELGLLPDRNAGLLDNFMDALAIENGRLLATGTRGASRLFNELLDEPPRGVVAHCYGLERDQDPGDPAVWAKCNPGMGAIKSQRFMRDAWDKAKASGATREFLAWNLNARLTPARELLIPYDQLTAAYDPEVKPVEGERCWVGLDLGGSAAQSAAVIAYESGVVRLLAAFPDQPIDLAERGRRDGCGDLYLRGLRDGDLILTSGSVTDIPEFLAELVKRVGPHEVVSVSSDRYRSSELWTALRRAGLSWKTRFRGSGPRDGNADILATRKLFLAGSLKLQRSQLLEGALAESDVKVATTGAAQLDKASRMSRIDLAQALVLACSALLEAREAVAPTYSVEVI